MSSTRPSFVSIRPQQSPLWLGAFLLGIVATAAAGWTIFKDRDRLPPSAAPIVVEHRH